MIYCSCDCRDDSISAIVEGTRSYQVEIQLRNGLPDTMNCTCPYAEDGCFCKHMAAVLCRHFDFPLLEEPRDAADIAAADLIDMAEEYSDQEGEIDWQEGPEFIDEFRDYLSLEVQTLLEEGKIESASEVIKCGYMFIATVVMNGALGEHGDGVDCCRELWKDVLRLGSDDLERNLYRWFQTIENAECYQRCMMITDSNMTDLFMLPEVIEQNCRMLEEELVTCELEQYGEINEILHRYIRQLKKKLLPN